ncbi:MAG: hypothetical protein K2N29_06035, partial [Ruminiclostridium sp.]|nr:hypothetical protein [Ruminiclostridium sp.]
MKKLVSLVLSLAIVSSYAVQSVAASSTETEPGLLEAAGSETPTTTDPGSSEEPGSDSQVTTETGSSLE